MVRDAISRLAREPPFRIAARALIPLFRPSIATRALWELSPRPQYLLGVYQAVKQAQKEGVAAIAVIEFGVAGGTGLVALQGDAARVEQETGVKVKVYGFDAGAGGLPEFIGDYRDHPDAWKPGDYPMNVDALKARLTDRTALIIGNVRDTVPVFFTEHRPPPIGFVSFDLDLYSSTRDALRIFTSPGAVMLNHTPLYFDDIEFLFNHRYAGEFLAIEEFNQENDHLKIDRWHGVRNGRPFPERGYLDKMYVAHQLRTSNAPSRAQAQLPLRS